MPSRFVPEFRVPLANVAAYICMSTDMQMYSLENQKAAIDAYAAEHGMTVVRTYRDAGRSGLTIEKRPGLLELMDDIRSGRARFGGVLVLDVSRWGRFQNTDESAYYEFLCWRAGVHVLYVGESFENDQSRFALVFKGIKRAMAAEYSRELSVKVSAAQRRLEKLGYRQGAIAGYGLRRLLVSAEGEAKFILEDGDRRSLTTDRVVLVPGPPEEVRWVRWMFEQYLEGMGCSAIAETLNERGVLSHRGNPWVYNTIRTILDGEKYAGRAVYCRSSKKLAGRMTQNDENMWCRKDDAYEAIVPVALFSVVRAERLRRRKHESDEVLLAGVRRVLRKNGQLTGQLLDAEPKGMSSHGLARRFGGLTGLYKAVGFKPKRHLRYADVRRWLTAWRGVAWRESLTAFAVAFMEGGGSTVERDGWRLRIDNAWTLSFVIVHGSPPPQG